MMRGGAGAKMKTISIWAVIIILIMLASYAVRVKMPISVVSTKQQVRFPKPKDILNENQNMIEHRYHNLSRVGNQLKLDPKTCRPYLIDRDAIGQPLHDDCPQVFIIGARKGGTTSLTQYLSQHPNFTGANLGMSYHAGETGYFTRYYENPWEWYKSQCMMVEINPFIFMHQYVQYENYSSAIRNTTKKLHKSQMTTELYCPS